MALASPGTAFAAYGPPPPPGAAVSSYYRIVTSFTVGPAGVTFRSVQVGRFRFTLTVPSGTFMSPAQVTLTAPATAGMGHAAMPQDRALGGVGVLVQQNGSAYRGQFRKPIMITAASRDMTRGARVVTWQGGRFVAARGEVARLGARKVRLGVRANRDFAFVTRAGRRLAGEVAAGTGMAPASAGSYRAGQPILAQLPMARTGAMAGIGVLAPSWARSFA